MATNLSWGAPFRITATPNDSVNDIFGYVEGDVIALDSGLAVVVTLSSESYVIHMWAIDLTDPTAPVIGPDTTFNSDGNLSFYGIPDDPKLMAIGDLSKPVALGDYKFGITGEADQAYDSSGAVATGTGAHYQHVASIFSVDPATLHITRDYFVIGDNHIATVVPGEATTARWGDKMVILSDSASAGWDGSAYTITEPYHIWVVDPATGALTVLDIPNVYSSQFPSAIAVAGDTAYWWQQDSGSTYTMHNMALGGGSAAALVGPSGVSNNNFTWYGHGISDGSVVWLMSGDFGTTDYPFKVAWAGPSSGGLFDEGQRDIGTGWTGGWYSPTRAISIMDDGVVLTSSVRGGVFKYQTFTVDVGGPHAQVTGSIADFTDSTHYYDYFVASTAALPQGGAIAMWVSRHYNGGDDNFGIYLSLTVPPPYWRNLVINPSAEQSFDRAWTASNGTIDTAVTWEV